VISNRQFLFLIATFSLIGCEVNAMLRPVKHVAQSGRGLQTPRQALTRLPAQRFFSIKPSEVPPLAIPLHHPHGLALELIKNHKDYEHNLDPLNHKELKDYLILASNEDDNHLNGQDPETRRTALIEAVLQKSSLWVAFLSTIARLDVNIKDKDGFTALMRAIQNDDSEMVRILLSNNYHKTLPFFTPNSMEYKVLQQLRAQNPDTNIPEQLAGYLAGRCTVYQ
jgi:hypothetical protein